VFIIDNNNSLSEN
jgi:hypothetical protein